MAFRTDLAVEAIENHKTAAALPHVRQSDRTLEARRTRGTHSLRGCGPRDRQPQGATSRLTGCTHPP